MKIKVTLKIIGTRYREFQDLWNKSVIKKNQMGSGMIRTIKGSKTYNQFMKAFQEFSEENPGVLEISELRSDTIYDTKDFEKSSILELAVISVRRISLKEASAFFELKELCPECKRSSYVQNAKLAIIPPMRDEDIFRLISDEEQPQRTFAWIVSRRLKKFLETQVKDFVSFSTIIDKRAKQISEDYYQLHINHIYPPCKVPPTQKVVENICSRCDCPFGIHLGTWNSLNSAELYYSSENLRVPPIGVSHEQWGKQVFLTDMARTILVNQDLYRALRIANFIRIGFNMAHVVPFK